MSVLGRCWSFRSQGLVVAVLALSLCACGSDSEDDPRGPEFAVLSAFPAELAPLLEQATIEETVEIDGRPLRVGKLGGARVVLGLTGIGLANATTRTRAVLEHFEVRGVVVSGVAGSPYRIADVAVPETWNLLDGPTYEVHREWIGLAEQIAAPGAVALERCTVLPNRPTDPPVCMPFEPAIVVGRVGQSSDPYRDMPFPCQATGNSDVFGCDVMAAAGAMVARGRHGALAAQAPLAPEDIVAEDMETAAIAAEAAAHGVPFIAFRATSDGAEDPLGLPGYPAQFFAYYRLAAHNAAAAAVAFLERVTRS